jgi:hypothetical protein
MRHTTVATSAPPPSLVATWASDPACNGGTRDDGSLCSSSNGATTAHPAPHPPLVVAPPPMQRWGIDRVGPVMGRGSADGVGAWGFSFFLFLLLLFAVFLGQPTRTTTATAVFISLFSLCVWKKCTTIRFAMCIIKGSRQTPLRCASSHRVTFFMCVKEIHVVKLSPCVLWASPCAPGTWQTPRFR